VLVVNLRILVLDAMADDIEDVAAIMRYLSPDFLVAVSPDFLALVNDVSIVETLSALLKENLVEAYGEVPGLAGLHWVERPDFTPATITRYWFRPTRAGRELWAMWPGPDWNASDIP